ncbi:MAG: mevalonate kinase [Conexivisphaera sp.]|jgi:mevalonate kinase
MRALSRAPAKVILMGEHFVVHGGRALAVSIDLWATAVAEPGPQLSLESEDPPGACRAGECASHLRPLHAMLEEMVVDHPRALGRYHLSSGISRARGLGSSAATAVSLAAAALALAEGDAPRDDVYRYAMISERIIHGNPSGVDPAVSTYGGAILYSKSEGMRRLSVGPGELVVCCGASPRSTAAMVESVAEFRRSREGLFEALMASSSDLVARASEALESGDVASLAPIIRWHQGALRVLGVSSPELESYVAAMESSGMAAKLTGAGGGGCAIGLGDAARGDLRCPAATIMRVRYPTGGVESWVQG